MRRVVIWSGIDEWRAEGAIVNLESDGMRATGTQLGMSPFPYHLEYELDAAEGYVTRSLQAEATGETWTRRLRLSRDGEGRWRCETEVEGDAGLPPPGGAVEDLEGALDCDIAFSPLTNLMPVRRNALHEGPGQVDLMMAWVSVPDLGLHPSRQRYEHIGRDSNGAKVQFKELEGDGFEADLVLDRDGLIVVYPQLARRVDPPA
jgi:hypothetical protein